MCAQRRRLCVLECCATYSPASSVLPLLLTAPEVCGNPEDRACCEAVQRRVRPALLVIVDVRRRAKVGDCCAHLAACNVSCVLVLLGAETEREGSARRQEWALLAVLLFRRFRLKYHSWQQRDHGELNVAVVKCGAIPAQGWRCYCCCACTAVAALAGSRLYSSR